MTMPNWGRNPNPVRGTGRVRMVQHPDGTPGFEVLDEYTEVVSPGIPWWRLLGALLVGAAVVLILLGALSTYGWLTGHGFYAGLETCPTHLAGHGLPSALPSVPVH